MRKKRTPDEALSERRRQQVSTSAIRLFSRKGYHPTSVRDVADDANCSIGMIYQYFADKEQLLFYSLVRVLNDYRDEIPPAIEGISDPLIRFCRAVHAYGHVQAKESEATALAYRETISLTREHRDILKALEIETNDLIAEAVRGCIEAGLFTEVDVEMFTYQIVLHSHAWSLKSWNFASRMTVEEYIDRGLKLLLVAVLTGRGERHFQSVRSECLKSERETRRPKRVAAASAA